MITPMLVTLMIIDLVMVIVGPAWWALYQSRSDPEAGLHAFMVWAGCFVGYIALEVISDAAHVFGSTASYRVALIARGAILIGVVFVIMAFAKSSHRHK